MSGTICLATMMTSKEIKQGREGNWGNRLWLDAWHSSITHLLGTYILYSRYSAFTPPFSTIDHSEPGSVLDNYRWPAGINDFLWQTQGAGSGG
jgi:hypothetical protein